MLFSIEEELCLATPRAEVPIHVIVRGDVSDMDICGSQHLMDYLKGIIYSDFNETSGGEMCHFELDGFTSCSDITCKYNEH